MSLTIGDTAPDFEADSTEGRIRFHEWIGDDWAVGPGVEELRDHASVADLSASHHARRG